MANERITEDLVRDHFKNDPLFSNIVFEEQQSSNPRINKLLKSASKSGSGKGFPEFIISFPEIAGFLIVVECKADLSKHESKNGNNPKDFAVDGVKLYSSYLSKEFDVLSVAVSGEKKSKIKISHFLQLKNKSEIEDFCGAKLLSIDNYINAYKQDEKKFKQSYEDLLKYSKILNDVLHSKKVKESERSLLISGILISLEDDAFKASYEKQNNPKNLAENLVSTIKQQLSLNIESEKAESLIHQYGFIKIHPTLSKNTDKHQNVLRTLIKDIDNNINSFMKTYRYHDVLGQFYIEFLRYANNDKGLGIILTPPHITDLFSGLAFVDSKSIVLDNCTGTGGFLISAMQKMIADAKKDERKIEKIKKSQLIGIEQQPNIFALACSNMYIHGDGKSNIYYGSCFDKKIIKTIKRKHKPTAGFLNPPYKANKDDVEEFEFVLNNLSMLERGAYCVAIIPMSCVLAQKGIRLEFKKQLLLNHTLKAVFSMPDELFANSKVGVITCVVVFKAHQPHPENYLTYFGHWKNDGFYKRKTTGRADYAHKWPEIKNNWLNGYKARQTVAGHSVVKFVKPEDEWCAEAYMETDYSKLKKENFDLEVLKYSSYLFFNKKLLRASNLACKKKAVSLRNRKWKYFALGDQNLFEIAKGRDASSSENEKGERPLVSATRENNGVSAFVLEGNKLFPKNTITIPSNGASTGEAFYQESEYFATTDVNILSTKFPINKYIALFLTTIIRLDKYRFSYGRKWGRGRMMESKIMLPVDTNKNPDWKFMEEYIKALPYSKNI